MGLLDSKKQFLDTIVTDEGRRQLALGRMRIRFATFTDQDAFYEADHISGTTDASLRPHLEAYSKLQDTITFESNDVGLLMQYKGTTGDIINGNVLVATGANYLNFPSREQRRDAQLGLLTSSIDNFKTLYAIATEDLLGDDNLFRLSDETIHFDITSDMLKIRQGFDTVSIEDSPSLFQDRRVAHAPNFRYLPPRNAATTQNPGGSSLGQYPRLDQGEILTIDELRKSLNGLQMRTVNFSETSRESNIFGQMFEVRDDVIRKLDIIDFGEFINQGADGGSSHVFFAGKLFLDENGTHTFINLFTLVFS